MTNRLVALSVVLVAGGVVSAQVVTPAPGKSVPAPAWTPPPEAPKPPPPPPEPDVKPVDIVKLDGAGKIVWPSRPFEVVIFEGLPTDEGQKKSWNEKFTARQAAQDEAVVKNLGAALRLRDALDRLDELTELGQLIALAEPLKAVSVQPAMEQFVKSSQVLRPKQLSAFNESVKHFRAKTTEELNKRVGDDKNLLMVVKSRESVKDRSTEAMWSLGRMCGQLAGAWEKTKAVMNLSGDFGAAEKLLAEAKDEEARQRAGLALLRSLPAEKQAEVLAIFRTPAPPPPKPPADPAAGVDLPKPPAK